MGSTSSKKLLIVSPEKGRRHTGTIWEWSNGTKEVWWYQDTWGFDFHFLQCSSLEQFRDWLSYTTKGYHTVPDSDTDRLSSAAAMHVMVRGKFGTHCIIVFFDPWKGTPTHFDWLLHEMTHLVLDVLRAKGVGSGPDADEARCYLAGSMAGDLLRILGYQAAKSIPWKWSRTDTDALKHPSRRLKK